MLVKLYSKIGKKIKSLAVAIAVLGTIASFITGIVIATIAFESFWMFLLVAVGGAISSYIGSFFIYGFGELIDKATEIAENTASLR